MNQFLKRAKELESQLQADRRYLHQHAEAGEDLQTQLNTSWSVSVKPD